MPARNSVMLRQLSVPDWLALFNITEQDLTLVREYGERLAVPALDDILHEFYARLASQPEYGEFFKTQEMVRHVFNQQKIYWEEFWAGKIDDTYIVSREQVGRVHANIALSLRIYYAGMLWFNDLFSEMIDDAKPADRTRRARAIRHLMALDTAVVMGSYEFHARDSLQKMSVPLMPMWEGCVLVPVVGHVDNQRGQDIMNMVLATSKNPKINAIIIDTSGMPAITADRDLVLDEMVSAIRDSAEAHVVLNGAVALWYANKPYTSPKITAVPTLSEALIRAMKHAPASF